jgi:phosphopantothenate synthetase
MSAVYIKSAASLTMTVSRLPVVAVNGPVEINCINATAALSGVLKRQLLLMLGQPLTVLSLVKLILLTLAATAGTYILTVTKSNWMF